MTDLTIVCKMADSIITDGARSVVHFFDDKTVVKATRRGKIDYRRKHIEIIFSVGLPNYKERQMISWSKKPDHPKVNGKTFYFYK